MVTFDDNDYHRKLPKVSRLCSINSPEWGSVCDDRGWCNLFKAPFTQMRFRLKTYISILFGLASILKRSSFSSRTLSTTVESENGDFEYLQRENSWCAVCANGKPMEICVCLLCNTLSKQGLELVKQTEHIFPSGHSSGNVPLKTCR